MSHISAIEVVISFPPPKDPMWLTNYIGKRTTTLGHLYIFLASQIHANAPEVAGQANRGLEWDELQPCKLHAAGEMAA